MCSIYPLYNRECKVIQSRNVRFENGGCEQVFASSTEPNQIVFRIIRHGVAGDANAWTTNFKNSN